MKRLITILFILYWFVGTSQCVTGTPPTLTCGTPINVASNTASGVYGSASTGNPSCAISGDKITDADLYAIEYQPGKVIHIDMCLTPANYLSILSQDGCTELACENYGTSFSQDGGSCNGLRRTTISMDDLGLTVGDTYYIKVQGVANCGGSPCSSASIGGRSYTIECETVLANSCSNGVPMSGNQTYGITNSVAADNPSNANSEGIDCGFSIENNLMYRWCTDAVNTPVSLDIANITMEAGTSVQFAVLDDNCGGNFNDIQCNSGISTDQTILITGTVANTCYWLSFDGNAGSVFSADVTLIDAAPLPIELVHWDGEEFDGVVVLNWITASEINNDKYEIYWSVDTENWKRIGEKMGAGTTSTFSEYYHTHKTQTVDNYYKLKQIDFNGDFEEFKIIYVSVKQNEYDPTKHKYINTLGQEVNENYQGYKIKLMK